MPKMRKELVRGIAALIIFLMVIIASDISFPNAIKQSNYVAIGIEKLNQNPAPYEGENISSQVRIISDLENGTYIITEKGNNVTLIVPVSLGPLATGDLVYIRGISWIQTNNSIAVHEFHILDNNSSLIRSVPGIVIFVILFFSVFTIDFKQLAFVRRNRQSA